MVVGHGLRLTLVGLVLGLGLAVVCSRLASGMIFGVSPGDPLTFVSVPLTLLAVACLASYLPARRAARIAPTDALRYD
jgi:putative ABC transport system permease protein